MKYVTPVVSVIGLGKKIEAIDLQFEARGLETDQPDDLMVELSRGSKAAEMKTERHTARFTSSNISRLMVSELKNQNNILSSN